MRIFRIHRNGEGMYFGGSIAANEMFELGSRHPPLVDDTRLCSDVPECDPSLYKYGFGSLAQLRNWVYREDWRGSLEREGFLITEYDTSVVYYGDTQAVWPKDNPVDKVRDIPWEEVGG